MVIRIKFPPKFVSSLSRSEFVCLDQARASKKRYTVLTKEVWMNLQIGAGGKVIPGWKNLDLSPLPGIDVVHNLNSYPWPFADGEFEHILAIDVLEHLDDLVKAMEEIHRILKPNGTIEIRVPYWNSYSFNTDPTHKIRFTEDTLRFFVTGTPFCNDRFYYSKARFSIVEETFLICPINPKLALPFFREVFVRSRIAKRIAVILANTFNNVIQCIQITLKKDAAE